MKPIFAAAKNSTCRIVFAEGEDERVLRAVQMVVDESLAKPILVGRPSVIAKRIERFGLRMKPGLDIEIVNPEWDERYRDYCRSIIASPSAAASPRICQDRNAPPPYPDRSMLIHKDAADA